MKLSSLAPAVALLATISAVLAAPANDLFNSPTVLTGTQVTVTATNVDATKEIGEPDHGANIGGKSVWWTWTATDTGSVIIHTAGSSFDTLLAAYTGTALGNLQLAASNDDNGSVKTSLIGFNVIAGTTYRIAVDGYTGASGRIELSLSYRTGAAEKPANDPFTNRVHLTGTTVMATGSSFFATKERNEPNHAEELGGASVWWSWSAPATGNVVIKTEGSTFDTLLGVYTGSALTNLVLVAGNDDVSTNQTTSMVTFRAAANTVYQIAVDGFDGEPGDIQLHIQMQDVVWLESLQPVAGGGYKLAVNGPAGRQYAIEVSTDLLTWDRLTTVSNQNGRVEFTDASAAQPPRRCYRAQQLP